MRAFARAVRSDLLISHAGASELQHTYKCVTRQRAAQLLLDAIVGFPSPSEQVLFRTQSSTGPEQHLSRAQPVDLAAPGS
jgi:uncharacterized protein (DUF2336 family)